MTAAIAWFVFGAITAALSLQLPLGTLRAPGSGFFPLVLGVLLMGLAAAEAARLLFERPKAAAALGAAPKASLKWPDPAAQRVLLFIGAVALTTALLQLAGYVASTFLLMLGLLRILGSGWRTSLLIAAGSAAAAHVVFVRWLDIPMPAGPLGF